MNLIYKKYLTKLSRFNQWEKEYEANKSDMQKISEFICLFNLAMQMPQEIKKQAHEVHLQNLIDDHRSLREMNYPG